MNLAFIRVLQDAFGLPVGLSDHTETSLAAAIAVAQGVTWIEKHFTLDRSQLGFDHAYAMEPAGLRQYIDDVRASEEACRLNIAKLGEQESVVKRRARRGLYAARDIQPGEVLSRADVLVVRPEGLMAPNELVRVVGSTAQRGILQYQALAPGMFAE